jgi:hypothetical protein
MTEKPKRKIVLECIEVTGECPAYNPGSRVIIDTALIYRDDEWPDSELEGKSIERDKLGRIFYLSYVRRTTLL